MPNFYILIFIFCSCELLQCRFSILLWDSVKGMCVVKFMWMYIYLPIIFADRVPAFV